MKKKFPILDLRFPIENREGDPHFSSIANRKSQIANRGAFTLVEVLMVMVLLSLIVLVLMAVFNTTQTAFRASVTQTDVLEGGRAAMDLITGDLREMSPSLGNSNSVNGVNNGLAAVNFYANTNLGYVPLVQTLTASLNNQQRTYVLQQFFILNHQNTKWWGVGYMVLTNSPNGLYSLYRFQYPPDESAVNPLTIFTNQAVRNFFSNPTNGGSHLIDGVVGLRVRAFDNNGAWMTNGYAFGQPVTMKNVLFLPTVLAENGFYMFSNALPASVEIEMDTLEDRILQRAESLPNNSPAAPPNDRRTIYLQGQSGKVHVFRQRVSIPNVDPAAY